MPPKNTDKDETGNEKPKVTENRDGTMPKPNDKPDDADRKALAQKAENAQKAPADIDECIEQPAQFGLTKAHADDLAAVIVAKPFTLTTNTHRRIRFVEGVYEIPRILLDHFYVKANGVKLARDRRAARGDKDEV